ncbi:DUF4105 domain-containing protein [Bdellovibrio sp. SKB1291214]|uniref:Lnb N-terminal periplasmic domain-containing protein n=1 Tax=Bdellovibrio sp. SKB1291214 TaxID=1732569 RepID=UPI001594F4C4|nr:DUF4105 domain-containing protein [Bdellovibrio sp. SKB1291214]UYL09984.1 DUF4105 domain-containing protein [Bdellovibrio sp. SKB1291214]
MKLDQDQQWLNLLNYRRDSGFSKQSQADSPLFFFSKKGKQNPQAELIATIQAIFDPTLTRPSPEGNLQERAQCLFPGRFLYLKRHLPEAKWPQVSCQRFENFRGILDAHSATYVFSSYYMNNPASAYGHSFLRLNRGSSSSNEKKYELIDFGVGFSGVPEGATPATYAVMGLMGMFTGRFEIQPYYFKVREYNNFESRDLWEYDLDLTQDEIDLLVAHVYELQQAHFDYWYFTENCSYRIIAALDAVRPSLNLVQKTKRAVLPSDTMIMVYEAPGGLVRKLSYRPSGRATFEQRLTTLNQASKEKFAKFIQSENIEELVNGSTDKERQELLDAAIDYVDFRYASEVLHQKGQFKLKKQILIARAEVNLVSPELEIPVPMQDAPHQAHGSSRAKAGYLYRNDKNLATLGHRFALHDLLDPIRGYPAYSEMQMIQTDFSYDAQAGRVQLEKIGLVEIVSLSNWDIFTHAPSWRLKFGWDRDYQTECSYDCMPLSFSIGAGLAKELTKSLTASAWIRAGFAYDQNFVNDQFRMGIGPAVLLRYNWKDSFSLLAEAWYRYDNHGSKNEYRDLFAGAQVALSKNLGLRLGAKDHEEYRAELNFYY